MSLNDRIFYATQAVGIQTRDGGNCRWRNGPRPPERWYKYHFQLGTGFELGQIEIYENIEGTDVE